MVLPRGYISHSQIRAYGECPRKYRFAYIEDIHPPVNEKVFLGEAFHASIEYYFKGRISGAPPAEADVEAFFRAALDDLAPGRKISWQAPKRETLERGLAFLRSFMKNIAPGARPLMVEKELSAELPGSGVLLKGVLDLVEEDFCITDFKTTTGRWSESRVRHSPQMIIYKYLFDRSFGPVPSSMKYEVFYGRKAGSTRHQTLRVVPGDDSVDNLLAMIDQVATNIAAGAFEPKVTPFCRHCEFRSWCREQAPA
jgi:putative RecB family exonuclease